MTFRKYHMKKKKPVVIAGYFSSNPGDLASLLQPQSSESNKIVESALPRPVSRTEHGFCGCEPHRSAISVAAGGTRIFEVVPLACAAAQNVAEFFSARRVGARKPNCVQLNKTAGQRRF